MHQNAEWSFRMLKPMALRHPKCSKTFVKPEGVLDLWVALRLQLHYVTHYFWFILYWLDLFCIGSAMQHIQVLARLANAGCICAGIAGQKNRRERERKPTLRYSHVFVNIWMVLDWITHWSFLGLNGHRISFPKLRSRWCSPRPNLGAGGGHVSPLRACTKWGHAGHAGRDVDAGAQLGVGLSSIRFQDLIIWIYMDHTDMEIIWKAMGMTWPKKNGKRGGVEAQARWHCCAAALGDGQLLVAWSLGAPYWIVPGPSQPKRFLGSAIPLMNHEDPLHKPMESIWISEIIWISIETYWNIYWPLLIPLPSTRSIDRGWRLWRVWIATGHHWAGLSVDSKMIHSPGTE